MTERGLAMPHWSSTWWTRRRWSATRPTWLPSPSRSPSTSPTGHTTALLFATMAISKASRKNTQIRWAVCLQSAFFGQSSRCMCRNKFLTIWALACLKMPGRATTAVYLPMDRRAAASRTRWSATAPTRALCPKFARNFSTRLSRKRITVSSIK